MRIIKQVINDLENSKAPFFYFILTFVFIITLRNFIEPFSSHNAISLWIVIHFSLFYLAFAVSLILLLYAFTKTTVIKIAKVVFPGFIVIILAPLLDLLLSKGKGWQMTYLLPGIHDDLGYRFITFWGHFSGSGVTPGIRIELAIALVGIFIYCYIKTSKIIKSLVCTFLTYIVLFCFGIVPFIIKWVLFLNKPSYSYSDLILSNFYLLIITLISLVLIYISDKSYIKLIIADIKPMIWRILHYILMLFLGFALAKRYYPGFSFFNGASLFYILSIPISIFFALLFSLAINNIEDYEIDKITNQDRPLAGSRISLDLYKKLSWIFLFIALIYAAMVSFQVFFTTLLFIGIYFLYSAPPFRLKRVPIFSKFLIAFDSLLLVFLGFILIAGNISQFPKIVIVIFLVGYTLTLSFIDIKDYEGDKKEGIKTLPVMLGLSKSKFIIALIFFLSYFVVGLITKSWYMIVLFIIFGALEFYLINREDYKETPIFLVYLTSLLIIIFYLSYLIPPS